jgi:iron complex outermembrane recepter protein
VSEDLRIEARVAGTYLSRNTRFTSPTDPTADDDFVGEAQVPEWAFNTGLSVITGPARLTWQSFWQSKQLYQGVEVEDADTAFAQPNQSPNFWSHNVSFEYELNDQFTFRGGIQNLTNERPYASEAAYPVSARGRSFFLGATARF